MDYNQDCQSSACSGHGTCTKYNTCKCDTNYQVVGTYEHICAACPFCTSGVGCADEEMCNNNGACIIGICQCRQGYDPATKCKTCNKCSRGDDCEMCSSRGLCELDKCVCDSGYHGKYCEKTKKKKGGAIAGGVIAALVTVGAACGAFIWYRNNPGRPFTDIFSDMGQGIQSGYNHVRDSVTTTDVDRQAMNSYTSSGTGPSGGSAGGSGGGYGSTSASGSSSGGGGGGGNGSTHGGASGVASSKDSSREQDKNAKDAADYAE